MALAVASTLAIGNAPKPDDCETRLSRYNPDSFCSVHRGWDRQVVTRRRRAEEDEG